MRIGVMLRAMREKQGTGIYTKNLISSLLALDHKNEYVLFYRDPGRVGQFGHLPRVTERLVRAPGKALWDQILIPIHAWRDRVDLIFHPKFTVPLFTRCKTVMTIHGASWFVHPELYSRMTIAYIRTFMPLYCKRADAILSNSELTTRDFVRILGVPESKITTTHLGTGEGFRVIDDDEAKAEVRGIHQLPREFILSVSRFDPRKNLKNLFEAFRLLRRRISCKLVVTGIGFDDPAAVSKLVADDIADDVFFVGWVDHTTLPLLYNMARCLFFPSVYEEFGIPACEAMACGCPPVVSNTGALPEVVGEAGLLVNPLQPDEMADALERLYTDHALHAELSAKSLLRAQAFTWSRCAATTLDVLNRVGGQEPAPE